MQGALDNQLTIDANLSYKIFAAKQCEDQSMAVMEAALLRHRPDLLTIVYASVVNEGNPFDPKPWQASA